MPEWVIVREDADGEPLVLTDWQIGLVWTAASNVRLGRTDAAVFRDRWRAKRILRSRNLWPVARLIHREHV